MSETASKTTLADIAETLESMDSQTPSAVIDAFLPKAFSSCGQKLVPLTAGHELLLSQLKHPFATKAKFEDVDVLTALFVFSRPSRQLFALVAADDFEAEFFKFIDSIPAPDIAALGSDMVSHWLRSRATALRMENPDPTPEKKTADLAGGWQLWQALPKIIRGIWTKFCTKCHLCSFLL